MMIPKQLSVRDKGYQASVGAALTITVDGVEQRAVIAYDIDAGSVLRYVENDGHIVFDPATEGAKEETVFGSVKVTTRAA